MPGADLDGQLTTGIVARRVRASLSSAATAALLAVAAFAASPEHAAAQQAAPKAAQQAAPKTVLSGDEVERRWDTLTAAQQFEILEQLVKRAELDLADRLLSRPHRHRGLDASVHRFYVGMVRQGQGRTEEAVAIYREILVSNPGYTRVRLELAHVLYSREEDAAARHHFELVLGGLGTNPGLSQAVQSYLAAIDSRRTWDFSTFVSVAPSTNFNQGAHQSIVTLTDQYGNPLDFQLDKLNRKTSGVGLITGVQGSYRMPLTDRLDMIAAGGGSTKLYKDNDFDTGLLNASLGPRYRFDWGSVGIYSVAERIWSGREAQATAWGGLVSTSIRLTPLDVVHTDFTCTKREYSVDWKGHDLSHQDGHACAASGRYDRSLTSWSFVRALGAGGQERTAVKHLDNDFWTAGLGLYSELAYGIGVYVQGSYTQRQYDGIYPYAAEARKDDRWDAMVNLTKRDWIFYGFVPQVQYTYTHNDSNVALFRYDAHGGNLTVTKRF